MLVVNHPEADEELERAALYIGLGEHKSAERGEQGARRKTLLASRAVRFLFGI